MAIAPAALVRIGQKLTRWGGARLSRRLRRSIPILGTVIAAATIVSTVRRKGVVSGTFDTGLNAMPFIGALKNAVEILRGRDFFPDRYPSVATAPLTRHAR
jgi:hypothetical protein